MFGKKKKKRNWESTVLASVETAHDFAAPKLGAAADWAEGFYRSSAPKVQGATYKVLDTVNAGASAAGEKAKSLSSVAGDGLTQQYDKLPGKTKADIQKALKKYDGAKRQFSKQVVPAASAKLGGYAERTAELIHKAEVDPRVEKALVKATGDKKIVKKLRKNSEAYAKQTAKTLKKRQKSRQRRKGLLIFGLVAAGVTAGVAAWRASRPVEDPWKKPEPLTQSGQPSAPRQSQATPGSAAQKPQTLNVPQQHNGQNAGKAESSAQSNGNSQPPKTDVPKPKPAT